MIKHIGQHRDKKVVVLYRTVPDEDHMCLVAYSDALPNLIHEEVMRCVESPAGQAAEVFAEALFRVTMKDGRNALNALHSTGLIKKIPVNQVMLTPTTTTKVSLEEINKIVDQIKAGDNASKKLKEFDNKKPVEPKVTEALTDSDLAAPCDRQRLFTIWLSESCRGASQQPSALTG